jgi:RNA polymerase sigma-70 factor, ECF subfamily
VLKDSPHLEKVTRTGRPSRRSGPVVTNGRDENLLEGDRHPDREAAGYAQLIRAVQAGDRHAMERLLMRAQEVAYRFSLLVCGRPDDADDAMQEALLKTFRFAAKIREPEAFRAWLYRTVRNACLIGRRKRVDEPAQFVSLDEGHPSGDGRDRSVDVVEPSRDPEARAINAALRTRLARALHAVPRPYRVVVFLREIEGLSTKEVGEVVGISEANVKTRLHRARIMLREQLEQP